MSNFQQTILKLTKSLYPTGRAFKIPFNGVVEGIHKGLAISENTAYCDALDVLNSILPDNDLFTEEDATNWERRLGINANTETSLDDRKLAILRKMNHPGTAKARQHYTYLEGELQKAGFNLFVHENKFPDGGGGFETRAPEVVNPLFSNFIIQYNMFQYGDSQYGAKVTDAQIANHIDRLRDVNFVVTNLRSTFFIGGDPVGTFANVPIDREEEFRKLVLNIKPLESVAYLFINYTA